MDVNVTEYIILEDFYINAGVDTFLTENNIEYSMTLKGNTSLDEELDIGCPRPQPVLVLIYTVKLLDEDKTFLMLKFPNINIGKSHKN